MPHWWLPDVPVGEKILRSLICYFLLLVTLGLLKQKDSPPAAAAGAELTPDRAS